MYYSLAWKMETICPAKCCIFSKYDSFLYFLFSAVMIFYLSVKYSLWFDVCCKITIQIYCDLAVYFRFLIRVCLQQKM